MIPPSRRYRLGYLVSHPVQYQAPLLRLLAQRPEIDLKVYFLSNMSTGKHFDRQFGRDIEWDVPLLDGYAHEFLGAAGETVEPSRLHNVRIEDVLRRDRIEVLWQHGWGYATLLRALWRARTLGVKILMRGESTITQESGNPVKRVLKDRFLRWCFSRVSGFLCIGGLNREFYRSYGIAEDRLFDVPYAVDNAFFQARLAEASARRESFRASLSLAPERPILLFAGKLVEHKGVEDLWNAYVQLSPDGVSEPEAQLLFVGDGSERPRLEALARQRGWSGVQFLGFRNQTELPAFFDLCDVFVMPSRFEPWGLIVNEVMNAGKPIVCSDCVGCVPDLIKEGENGLLFRTGDAAHLAERLRTLISDPALRAQMGLRSRERIAKWSFQEDIDGILQAVSRVAS